MAERGQVEMVTLNDGIAGVCALGKLYGVAEIEQRHRALAGAPLWRITSTWREGLAGLPILFR